MWLPAMFVLNLRAELRKMRMRTTKVRGRACVLWTLTDCMLLDLAIDDELLAAMDAAEAAEAACEQTAQTAKPSQHVSSAAQAQRQHVHTASESHLRQSVLSFGQSAIRSSSSSRPPEQQYGAASTKKSKSSKENTILESRACPGGGTSDEDGLPMLDSNTMGLVG